jgi:hypothetical protein
MTIPAFVVLFPRRATSLGQATSICRRLWQQEQQEILLDTAPRKR